MKLDFIVIGPEYYNYSSSTIGSIQKMGYDVKFFKEIPFYENCSYLDLERKFYKLGNKSIKFKWDKEWNDHLLEFIWRNASANTRLIFLSGGGAISSNTLLQLKKYKKMLILWDSIKRMEPASQKKVSLYDKVYVFEYDDLFYINNELNQKNTKYLPVGYDASIYTPGNEVRDIDIAFVGAVTDRRFRVLEKVAKYAHDHKRRLDVYGKWYNNKWPWMTWSFRRKHADLFSCLHNYNIQPNKTADIYRRSKVVLNINNDVHKSISPRTFEILGTKSFQIMNDGQESNGTINLKKDLVLFESDDDLIRKIEYYILHENERKKIAQNGYVDCKKYSMDNLLKK